MHQNKWVYEMNETFEGSIAKKALFWFGAIFTIVAPIVIGTGFADPSTSWVAALCGAFITFISKLDEIAELSLGPVKAKMRETILQATATIEQVQSIAKNISETTLTSLMAGNFGFSDGLNLEARLNLHDRMLESLKEIGISETDISELDEKWEQGIGVIYHRAIAPLIDGRETPNRVNTNATSNQLKARKGWDELLEFDDWKAPTPEAMKSYLKRVDLLTPEINAWVNDYSHFCETGKINRRDLFVTK